MAYEDEEDRKEREEEELERLFDGLEKELAVADLCRQVVEETTKFSLNGKPLLAALEVLKTKIQQAAANGEDWSTLKKIAVELHQKLVVIREGLERRRDALIAENDSYAATQEFLVARGLKSTAELDLAGRKELLAHLEEILKKIVNP